MECMPKPDNAVPLVLAPLPKPVGEMTELDAFSLKFAEGIAAQRTARLDALASSPA